MYVLVSLWVGDPNQLMLLLIQDVLPISAPYGLCGPYGHNRIFCGRNLVSFLPKNYSVCLKQPFLCWMHY